MWFRRYRLSNHILLASDENDTLQTIIHFIDQLDHRPTYFFDTAHKHILFTIPKGTTTLADARRQTSCDCNRAELELGGYVARVHSIQNDWFGSPFTPGDHDNEMKYDWSGYFADQLESLIDIVRPRYPSLPYENMRQFFARAFAFYLFDDVEVPSLTTFTTSEEDVFVSVDAIPSIVAVIPDFTDAIWGDPLLESFWLAEGPSEFFLEGYVGSGGSPLISFPRHRTKRLWYTVFHALTVLAEERGDVVWAQAILQESVIALKDAPYYL